jgi:hypothetical protein
VKLQTLENNVRYKPGVQQEIEVVGADDEFIRGGERR